MDRLRGGPVDGSLVVAGPVGEGVVVPLAGMGKFAGGTG